jgi:hypothetical protein
MADETTTAPVATTETPKVEEGSKAKNIIFKSLKVGQLYFLRPEKGQEANPQQFVKQTKTDCMPVGRKDATLVPVDPKAKVSIYYNIKDFSKRAPKAAASNAVPATV